MRVRIRWRMMSDCFHERKGSVVVVALWNVKEKVNNEWPTRVSDE